MKKIVYTFPVDSRSLNQCFTTQGWFTTSSLHVGQEKHAVNKVIKRNFISKDISKACVTDHECVLLSRYTTLLEKWGRGDGDRIKYHIPSEIAGNWEVDEGSCQHQFASMTVDSQEGKKGKIFVGSNAFPIAGDFQTGRLRRSDRSEGA